MQKFISKTILLVSFTFCIVLFIESYSNHILESNKFFQINPKVNKLILGHSHTQCAVNDSLINNCINLSQNSDSYLYTYYKFKKIVEANSRIDTVLLIYTNNLFDKSLDEWFFGDKYLGHKYPKYSNLLSLSDKWFLFQNNPRTFIKSSLYALKAKTRFLLSNKKALYKEFDWGQFEYRIENNIEKDKLKTVKKNDKNINEKMDSLSFINFIYLKKIIKYCESKQIKIILLRTPLHPLYNLKNEKLLTNFKNEHFDKISFWDFKDYKLNDQDYIDFSHLNVSGANKFSTFLNQCFCFPTAQNGLKKSF